eukprot:6027046-Pleurochrysis_carterae.AAC.2
MAAAFVTDYVEAHEEPGGTRGSTASSPSSARPQAPRHRLPMLLPPVPPRRAGRCLRRRQPRGRSRRRHHLRPPSRCPLLPPSLPSLQSPAVPRTPPTPPPSARPLRPEPPPTIASCCAIAVAAAPAACGRTLAAFCRPSVATSAAVSADAAAAAGVALPRMYAFVLVPACRHSGARTGRCNELRKCTSSRPLCAHA